MAPTSTPAASAGRPRAAVPSARRPLLLRHHLDSSRHALAALDDHVERLTDWAEHLAAALPAGRRVIVAGNGGSAAHAQHLAAELVGRFRHDRPAFSALALTVDGATLTAIGNDYGFADAFARQVAAHGRSGDVLLALSTSGLSPNLLRAVEVARRRGLDTWALTGCGPNPLAGRCDSAVAVAAATTAAVQEAHQVAIHLLCLAFDDCLAPSPVGR